MLPYRQGDEQCHTKKARSEYLVDSLLGRKKNRRGEIEQLASGVYFIVSERELVEWRKRVGGRDTLKHSRCDR